MGVLVLTLVFLGCCSVSTWPKNVAYFVFLVKKQILQEQKGMEEEIKTEISHVSELQIIEMNLAGI